MSATKRIARLALGIVSIATVHALSQNPPWPDPIAEQVVPAPSVGLVQGPMLGRPAATSVRLWVRTEEAMDFEIRYARQLPLNEDSPAVRGRTEASADNTGFVDLSGLAPYARYYYGVVLSGQLADTRVAHGDPWPRFRTLPDRSTTHDPVNNPKGLFNLSFSLCVGASQDPKRSGGQYTDPPAWDTLHRQFGDQVMFHIMNGDYTYEESRDGTTDGIRANYKLYMDRSRGMNRFMRHTPWLQMFDDHEVHDNLFGAGQVGFRKLRSRHINRDRQLSVWNEYAGWANPDTPQRGPLVFGSATVRQGSDIIETADVNCTTLDPRQVSTILVGKKDRKTDAPASSRNAGTYGLVKVLDAHRIQVTPEFVEDETVDFSIGTHHYYDSKIGNCHFFVIDTRSERSSFNAKDRRDPQSFLLGDTQRQWLMDGIKRTDAAFIFIVSSVGVVVPHSAFHVKPEAGDRSKGDGFPGFVHERERILDELDQIDKPIIFFTGDVHASVSAQITDNLWEFMVAPFNSNGHPIGTLGNMPFTGWYNAEGRWARIKWVGSGPNNVHYSRLHRTFFAIARVNNVFSAPRPDGEGPGYQFIPYAYPQVVVTWYDGYTGEPVYSETVSPLDLEDPPEN
ncbi:MAG: alkaline phosphatase D family protein [Pirellulaceae bacterium]